MSRVDEYIDALWAALVAHGTSSADGVTVLVEQTGGGNEALVIRSGAYVVAVTDGDLGVLLGTSMDEAVEYTGDAWDDGGDYTAILDDASPLTVAAHVAIYCNPNA